MEQIRSLSQMIEEAKKLCASKGKKVNEHSSYETAKILKTLEKEFGFKIKTVSASFPPDTPKSRLHRGCESQPILVLGTS